jgi:hypothetical protein
MATKTYTIGTATITATSSASVDGLPTFVIKVDGKTSPTLSYTDMFNSSTGGASLYDAAGELIPGWALAVGNQSSPPRWRITTSNQNVGEGQYNTVFSALSQTADQAFKYFKEQSQVATPTPAPAPTTTPKPATTPTTTTSPSNALPLGDDIDDIYDPNLTPEQIASLSPGDRRARENFFIEEAGGTPNTDGLSGVEADGTIVVTAPAPEEEIITIAAQQDQIAFQARNDWRVRLALTDDPNANYLYKSDDPGILAPLAATNGVIFPYTPQISVNYAATYSPTELVHSNYKVFQYSSSSVDQVSITCEFTAQDTNEADYMLAVIHFFRSMTKMFYGKDSNPRRGTPPPLCYMFGMGNYQFAAHPLAITGFSYTLPTDVDYIKTMSTPTNSLESLIGSVKSLVSTTKRLLGTGAEPGGNYPPANLNQIGYSGEEGTVTWVPTKIQLAITCLPMMSRNQVSNNFSLKDYASGKLLNGINKPGGGMW